MISDGTAGIAARLVNDVVPADLPVNAEVQIVLKGLTLQAFQGLVQINNCPNEKVTKTGETKVITPTEITAEQFNSGAYQSMLVKVKDVQFVSVHTGKTFNDSSLVQGSGNTQFSLSTMEDANGNDFPVYVSMHCKYFATKTIPNGSGSIIGVGTIAGATPVNQLMPRYTTDFDGLTGERFAEAPIFEVDDTPVSVAAAGGEKTIEVSSNVAWDAEILTDGKTASASISGNSGTASGTITLNFAPNTDTDNTKTLTVRISTSAAATPNSYDVVFTQEKATPADMSVETFSGFSSTNNSYTAAAATGTYESTEITGLVWSYAGTAHNQNATKFIIGRYNGSNANPGSLTTSTIATGVGSISIDWKTPFNDTSTGVSFKVFVNDVEKGTFTLENGATNQTGTYTIDNVNVSGNAVIKIASNEKGRPGVNKVSWTSYN